MATGYQGNVLATTDTQEVYLIIPSRPPVQTTLLLICTQESMECERMDTGYL